MNIIFRNLLRRKARTLLTILGIGVGVTVIIVLGVLAEGFQAGYSSMMQGSKADLVLSQPDTMDVSYSAVKEDVGGAVSLAAWTRADAVLDVATEVRITEVTVSGGPSSGRRSRG